MGHEVVFKKEEENSLSRYTVDDSRHRRMNWPRST